jgi:hypothetical protein
MGLRLRHRPLMRLMGRSLRHRRTTLETRAKALKSVS